MHGRLKEKLYAKGFVIEKLILPTIVTALIEQANYSQLYDELSTFFRSAPGVPELLQSLHPFQHLELMLALRDSTNPDEEDGIWHDDGSRVLAFSLSLNQHPESIQGGELLIRAKAEDKKNEVTSISPLPLGHIALFLTGVHGYEHKVCQVTQGKRLILAGWCS